VPTFPISIVNWNQPRAIWLMPLDLLDSYLALLRRFAAEQNKPASTAERSKDCKNTP